MLELFDGLIYLPKYTRLYICVLVLFTNSSSPLRVVVFGHVTALCQVMSHCWHLHFNSNIWTTL